MLSLAAQKRDMKENLGALRRRGFMPAVMYGKRDASTPISVEAKAFSKVFAEAGESSIITLTTDGEEKMALIHDVAFDPVRDVPLHADFYLIAKGQTITVNVPLEFVGVSPAVKDLGGILVKVVHDLEVKVLPKDLPSTIEVNIEKLATLEDKITVKDLRLPETVVPQIPEDEVVAMIAVAKEEPEEPAAPIDLSQIETSVERGKKEEEGAAPEAGEAKKE